MRILLILIALLCGAFPAPAAWAHAVLVEAEPADAATLARSPAQLTLRFNERVTPIALALRNPAGETLAGLAQLSVADTTLTLRLPAPLPDGFYILSYRVTSADSHTVAGSITFAVGAVAAADRLAARASDGEAWPIAAAANRILFLALALIAGGGFLFGLVFGGLPVPLAKRLRAVAVLAATTAVLGIGLQGAVLLGDAARLFDAETWRIGIESSRGRALLLAAVSLLALAGALAPRVSPRHVIPGLLGLGGLAASLALSGHAATAAPFAGLVVAIHGLLAAAWVGSFLPLRHALRDSRQAAALLHGFSTIALPAVVLLVLAGALLAVLQVERVAALAGSAYGTILIAKVVAVAGLLVLAALNRFVLLPRLATDGVRLLRLTIGAELAVGIVVLAITTLLAQTVPPRAAALTALPPQAAGFGYTQTLALRGGTLDLTVTPARPGTNTIAVLVRAADGTPWQPRQVTLELSLPERGIEPIRRILEARADGSFAHTGRELALEGAWYARIEVLVSDFELVAAEAELHIH